MTKAVSNREICFIKAVLLLCEHGHFVKKNRKVTMIREKLNVNYATLIANAFKS